MQGDGVDVSTPVGALVGDVDPTSLQDINFDDGAFCVYNIIRIITYHLIQRITPIYTGTRCVMRRKRSLLRNKELSNSMSRLRWNERRIRRFNWQKRRHILGMILRKVERDLLGQAKVLSSTVSRIGP